MKHGRLTFSGSLKNASDATITTLSWPVLGDLVPPDSADFLYRENLDYGTMKRTPLWPRTGNERGYYGTNYPMQIEGKGSLLPGIPGAYHFPATLRSFERSQRKESTLVFTTPVRGKWSVFSPNYDPGISIRFMPSVPTLSNLGETPVHLTFESVHYPMAAPGETIELSDIVVEPYIGDWHDGVDIYRRWRTTWYRQAASPDWVHEVHSWQQIQIGSTEDDLADLVQ